MYLGVQIIGVGFALAMIYFTFLYYKRKDFSLLQFIFWEIVWLGLIFATLFPQTLRTFTKELGFARVFDFIVVLGILFVALIAFYSYVQVRQMRKKIEELTRKEALKDLKKK